MTSLSTEERALLGCARTTLDDGEVNQLSGLLGPSLNWERLLTLSQRHGITPLLFIHFVQTQQFPQVPSTIKETLKQFFRKHALFSQMLGRELGRLMQAFETEKIPAIPIKGPSLAVLAYGAIEKRMFGDLDILIKDQDIPRVSAMLLNQGYRYRVKSPETTETEPVEQTSRRNHMFVDRTGMIGLDIQSHIEGSEFSFQIDHKEFWDDLQQVTLVGNSVPSLDDTKVLLVLCIHGSKHLWCRLKWICDVAELLRSSPYLDWEKTLHLSNTYQCKTMLLLGLNLTHLLFTTPLPNRLHQEIRNGFRIPYLTNQVLLRLFPPDGPNPLPIPSAALFLNMIDQPWDRWRYWVNLAIGQSAAGYHTPLGPDSLMNRFLYMIVQPFRILGKYGIRSKRFKQTLARWWQRID